jgi:cytochrome P450 family 144
LHEPGAAATLPAMPTYDLADPTLLFRPDVLDDPSALYAALRAKAPVWEVPGTSSFVVTRADLVNEAVARPGDFSSNLASLIFRGGDGRPEVFDMAPLGDATHVMATADPPVHTAHRKLVQPHLTPAVVGRLADEITGIVDELLDEIVASGGGDVVSALADPLPMRVISRVIGLPSGDTPMLLQLVLDTDEILAGVADQERMQRAAAAAMQTGVYLADHLTRAMHQHDGTEDTGDTLLAVLARAVDAGALTFEECVGVLVQILSAGSETTTSLIAQAVRTLAGDRELQDRLRTSPGLVAAFLEEVLRTDGPFRFHYRTTTHATELGGVAIPAGARLLLMWAAANLDPDAYPEPEHLDVDRPIPKGHLAFGRGIHFCIGAPLARLEARIALERLLARTVAVELDPARPPLHFPSIFLRRLCQLGITVETS